MGERLNVEVQNVLEKRSVRSAFRLKVHQAEAKLIAVIRAIGFGEIEGLRVEGGLPVSYKAARKTCKFD